MKYQLPIQQKSGCKIFTVAKSLHSLKKVIPHFYQCELFEIIMESYMFLTKKVSSSNQLVQ